MDNNSNNDQEHEAGTGDDPRTATGTPPEVLGADVTEGRNTTETARGEPGSDGVAGSVMDNSLPTDRPEGIEESREPS